MTKKPQRLYGEEIAFTGQARSHWDALNRTGMVVTLWSMNVYVRVICVMPSFQKVQPPQQNRLQQEVGLIHS